MNYGTPQVRPVGAASKLIQAKQPNLTDKNTPGHIVAVSNLLEK